MKSVLRFPAILAGIAALNLLVPLAQAAGYPEKPIRLIVPYPSGGAVDMYARLIAQKLTETRGWVFVVENKPGAGGNIAMEQFKRLPADGYNLVMGQSSNLSIGPVLYPKLGYDPVKDFTPVTLVAEAAVAVVVPMSSPIKTMSALVAAAKAKPGGLMFASPGNGTVAHLSIEQLNEGQGMKLSHVPYKGTVQAMTDLVGGQLDGYMSSVSAASPYIRSGKVWALAIAGTSRIPQLPDVPTTAEAGFPDFVAGAWWGVLGPAGLPALIQAQLNAEINTVLKMQDVRDKITADGSLMLGGSPKQFADRLKEELEKWGRVVRNADIKVD